LHLRPECDLCEGLSGEGGRAIIEEEVGVTRWTAELVANLSCAFPSERRTAVTSPPQFSLWSLYTIVLLVAPGTCNTHI
jgi:hypothetical protein